MSAEVVSLHRPRPGDHSFLTCSCGESALLVVAIHDAQGAFIAALVCSECDTEIPISFGRPDAKA